MQELTMKILIYSQDGFGLGHLRRNLNICRRIRKHCPQATFLIIADSPVAPFFKLPPRCDFVKLPTIVKVDTGKWQPDQLPLSARELLGIRAEIISNVILSFRPDVFLVDHMPHGALGELAKPLQVLRKYSAHTKVVLGIRDILGAPEVIREQWQKEGAFAAVETFYDAVQIYGCAEMFDVAAEYAFPSSLVNKTRYCGYVCREANEPILPENALQNFFGERNRKTILVTGGGGADAGFFMEQFINAARLLHTRLPFNAFITSGPFMPKEQCQRLRRQAQDLPILVSRLGEDCIRFLRRADLIISMAGYNTISEILRFRKNAIVVPRAGPSAEQSMRSRLMSERGLFRTIHPQQLTAESLSDLVAQQLSGSPRMNEAMIPCLRGASTAAEFMLSI
jgi:predicted glycosyltransferase